MEPEEFKARVEALEDETGLVIDRPVAEHDGLKFGVRVCVLHDVDEDAGPFEGEEGYLILETVGSAKYNNERVMVGFLADGTDVPMEISPADLDYL